MAVSLKQCKQKMDQLHLSGLLLEDRTLGRGGGGGAREGEGEVDEVEASEQTEHERQVRPDEGRCVRVGAPAESVCVRSCWFSACHIEHASGGVRVGEHKRCILSGKHRQPPLPPPSFEFLNTPDAFMGITGRG
jgi:hypothetical protein